MKSYLLVKPENPLKVQANTVCRQLRIMMKILHEIMKKLNLLNLESDALRMSDFCWIKNKVELINR